MVRTLVPPYYFRWSETNLNSWVVSTWLKSLMGGKRENPRAWLSLAAVSCVQIEGETSSLVHICSSTHQSVELPSSFPSYCRRAIGARRAGSSKPTSPHVPAWGRGCIRFLGSAVMTARCSFASSTSTSICFVYYCAILAPTTPL